MHDVVAHNLSVMIALADGAAFAVARSPRQAADAMRSVSDTGRQALGEMRRLLGVLRDDETEAQRSPQPGLDDLDGLVEQVRGAGLPVVYQVTGRPFAVPVGAQLAVFRIVQEALTNTLKHAGADATAAVSLRYEPTGVEVEVIDTGRSTSAVSPFGHGLIGMRERTAVYGGSVAAGPAIGGGWRVHARVPLEHESIAG
jgi:signal transduction histidine kinase